MYSISTIWILYRADNMLICMYHFLYRLYLFLRFICSLFVVHLLPDNRRSVGLFTYFTCFLLVFFLLNMYIFMLFVVHLPSDNRRSVDMVVRLTTWQMSDPLNQVNRPLVFVGILYLDNVFSFVVVKNSSSSQPSQSPSPFCWYFIPI